MILKKKESKTRRKGIMNSSCSHFITNEIIYIYIISEPKSFYQVVTRLKWCKVIKQEIYVLEQNLTWSLVLLP